MAPGSKDVAVRMRTRILAPRGKASAGRQRRAAPGSYEPSSLGEMMNSKFSERRFVSNKQMKNNNKTSREEIEDYIPGPAFGLVTYLHSKRPAPLPRVCLCVCVSGDRFSLSSVGEQQMTFGVLRS